MPLKIGATLLNLIVPGMGLALLGHIRKAWLCCLLFLLVPAWATAERKLLQPEGWLIMAIAMALISSIAIALGLSVKAKSAKSRKIAWHLGGLSVGGLLLMASALYYRAEVLGIQFYFIPSPSMTPTLLPGDFILVDTWAYREKSPVAGDIIVFQQSDDMFVIKRCATWPDSSTVIRNNQLYVLGDNPQASLDSRRLGGINLQRVKGRALYRIAHWDSLSGKTSWPLQPLPSESVSN